MEDITKFLTKTSGYSSGSGSGYGSGYGYSSGSGYGSGSGSDYDYGYGSGSGSGYDYGDGSGSGYSDGSGYGNGYGSGYSDGSGSGSGYGDGYGYGYSSGYGDGSGYGNSSGYGDDYGYGYGVKSIKIKGKTYSSCRIDNVITFVKHIDIRRNILLGFTLNKDLTTTDCVVVKENNIFAHGATLKDAVTALQEKLYNNSTVQERIEKFKEKFEDFSKSYPNSELFSWHHILTGSCKFGREQFVKNHNINLNDTMTIKEFIELTRNEYGGDVIKKLLK